MLSFIKSRLAGKKLVLVLGLFFVLYSPNVLLQQDSLSDIFPLKIGNSWQYYFRTAYGSPAIQSSTEDEGTTNYIILNKIADIDFINWYFKAVRNFTRTIQPPNHEPPIIEEHHDTLYFTIVEKLQDKHELYTPTNDILSAFPFFHDAPDSERFYRYIDIDQSMRDTIKLVPDLTYPPFNVTYIVCKDTGIINILGLRWSAGSGAVTTIYQLIENPTRIEIFNTNIRIFHLSQNYPNPFNPSTKISWQSPVGGWQTLKVFDVLGNEVATLVNEYRSAGSYEIEFIPESSIMYPASGIYFYRLQASDYVETKKMILLK